jgi:hypothetical protein
MPPVLCDPVRNCRAWEPGQLHSDSLLVRLCGLFFDLRKDYE